MEGVVDKLHETYGFIRGEDKVGYFFIPSCMRDKLGFEFLIVGDRVHFDPSEHPKGPRAVEVRPVPAGNVDRPEED